MLFIGVISDGCNNHNFRMQMQRYFQLKNKVGKFHGEKYTPLTPTGSLVYSLTALFSMLCGLGTKNAK